MNLSTPGVFNAGISCWKDLDIQHITQDWMGICVGSAGIVSMESSKNQNIRQEFITTENLQRRIWKKLTIPDKILILILLTISVMMIILFPHHGKQGTVEVYHNNILQAEYPLGKDRIFEIIPGCKAEIKNGKVRMLHSTCRNQLCVKQGWSNMTPIVCMPEKISLVIRNGNNRNKIHILY